MSNFLQSKGTPVIHGGARGVIRVGRLREDQACPQQTYSGPLLGRRQAEIY